MRSAALLALALVAAGCAGGHSGIAKTAAQAPAAVHGAVATRHAAAPRVYPLTGLPVTNRAHALRPALSVKIDNVGPALPQAGLNDADLVTDVLVEGGLTRLFATFQSHDAPLIGPIRSARPVDANLLRELRGGIFAYSGAAPGEIRPSKQHSTALLISNDADPRWFWRVSSRPAPHNVFSSTARLYLAGRALRPHLPPAPQLFRYAAAVPAGRAVRHVTIPFSGFSRAAWTWTGHDYVRTQDGVTDRVVGGAQVSTTNVVILSVSWHSTHIIDPAGNPDPFVVTVGHGKAYVLRNGHLVVGHWVRPNYRVPVRILDAHGNVIALQPGRTWLELQPRPFTPRFS
jgi:hypothetical protein